MRSSTGWALTAAGLLATVLLPSGPAARVVAQDRHGGGAHADPKVLFSERCASCHVKPDPTVETDRAYIRQLQETA